jgi:hypothetical protein
MRGIGTIILAAIVSGFFAGTLQLQFAIWTNAHEEFISVEMAFMLFVLIVAVAFGIAVFTRASAATTEWLTVWLAVSLLIALAGLEGLMLWSEGNARSIPTDLPLLGEILVPGLLAILIQWWFVRRHIRKRLA